MLEETSFQSELILHEALNGPKPLFVDWWQQHPHPTREEWDDFCTKDAVNQWVQKIKTMGEIGLSVSFLI
ncbi:hypothetical protein [Paenibacillus sp. BGI2013]|uniref:hypothetical protein n=1 Tax=Paenibacillus sp. BGI2013 TaxID=2058902 RepID=UPI0015D572F5|nr:hypothetical protein [Paenibacillus sp. BGI2013]